LAQAADGHVGEDGAGDGGQGVKPELTRVHRLAPLLRMTSRYQWAESLSVRCCVA
jgi:hypothetical protein